MLFLVYNADVTERMMITPGEIQALRDLTAPVLDASDCNLPSARWVQPSDRWLPNRHVVGTGIHPAFLEIDPVERVVGTWEREAEILEGLEARGLVVGEPILNDKEGTIHWSITEEGAAALGKQLVIPFDMPVGR